MGPWGNLRVAKIDNEVVQAEIGMTVQLTNTSYPFHYHTSQEIYMRLTKPKCAADNRYMVMDWKNDEFTYHKTDDNQVVSIDGKDNRWQKWFIQQNNRDQWLAYIGSNFIHAFEVKSHCD